MRVNKAIDSVGNRIRFTDGRGKNAQSKVGVLAAVECDSKTAVVNTLGRGGKGRSYTVPLSKVQEWSNPTKGVPRKAPDASDSALANGL